MITIAPHGVRQTPHPDDPSVLLSPLQYDLITDTTPIRICGAPTGSGKTYAFLQSIRIHQQPGKTPQWVLFVVPTQALAANIAQSAEAQNIKAPVWDRNQRQRLEKEGKDVWVERTKEANDMLQHGGLVITTPETLGQIWLGVPYRQKRPEIDINLLLSATHLVFDEVHLLTERGLGFMQSWLTLIAGQAAREHTGKSQITLLSATHSELLTPLIAQPDDPDEHAIPNEYVRYIDETVESISSDSSVDPHFRYLHGPVTVSPMDQSVSELVLENLKSWMARHQRILIIFDSLRKYSQCAQAIEQEVRRIGLMPNEVFVVTGQDRQAGGQTLDNTKFDAGIKPLNRHRIIIGTSALEVGITYSNVTGAIMDPGFTPASLIQRIGRVARGSEQGEVLVAQSTLSHFVTLQGLAEQQTIWASDDFRRQFAPYVPIHWKRASALGSAYWSMMQMTKAPAYEAIRTLHQEITTLPVPGKQMNRLRELANQLRPNAKRQYRFWVDHVDNLLRDVRGFTPTVTLKFLDRPPISYSRDWALRYLRGPDEIDMESNCWIYNARRDECLLDSPRTIYARIDLPIRDPVSMAVTLPPGHGAYHNAVRQCTQTIRNSTAYLSENSIWESTCQFIEATGLLVWSEDCAPDIGGSMVI